MTKNHTVQVNIGAALAGSFKSAFSDGSKQLVRLGDSMKKLETRAKGLSSFNKLRDDVKSASDRLAQAENRVYQLRLEMQKTDKPTKQMRANFGRAQAAANKAREALKRKRNELGKLKNELKLTSVSSKGLVAEQTKLGTSADKLRTKYKMLNASIARRQSILNKRSELRGQALDMIALGAAIGAPLKASIDFESAFADVKKVLRVPEDEESAAKVTEKLRGELIAMTRFIPKTADELATIAAKGAQLGVATKDITAFTDTAAKMSTAFEISAEEAGQAMGTLSNVFDIPVEKMKDFGDVLNHLSDNTAATAQDITKALLRVGGPAGDFGLKPESVAALADTFIALGKPPQQAGTAINALLVKLNTAEKQSPKFQAGLEALGLSASELKESIGQDAEGALLSFFETVSKVEKQDRAGILFDLFGQEYVDDISLIAGKLGVYKKALAALTEKKSDGSLKRLNSMQKEFENRSNTTANKLTLLKNAFNELGIKIGDRVKPGVNFVVKSIAGMALGLSQLVDAFPIATSVIFGTVLSLIALKITSIGVVFAWTFVKGGAELVRGALLKMRIQALLSNVSFKAFNITSLITATRLKALAFAKVLAVMWGKLSLVVSLVKAKLLGLNAAALIASTRLRLLNAISLITAGRMKLLAIGGMVTAFAVSLVSLATRAIPIVIGGLRALTVAMLTNPIGLIISGIALVAGLVVANWQKVKETFLKLWEPIKPVWEKFAAFVGKIWDVISAPFKAIGSLFGFLFGGGDVEANVSANTINSGLQPAFADVSNLPIGSPVENNTYHNSFNFNVHAAEGQSVKQIADEVIRRIKAQSRGALFDQVPGVA